LNGKVSFNLLNGQYFESDFYKKVEFTVFNDKTKDTYNEQYFSPSNFNPHLIYNPTKLFF